MDKQKMVDKKIRNFPLVDAILMTPEEGSTGPIGICTNTTAPGQVWNEIDEDNRHLVSVLGPLIVNRDGCERMIINSLAHPTQKFLILFSEESLTFSPSTNLLLALMKDFDPKKLGNYISEGIASSPYYPNITNKIFDHFRQEIIVLPLFMHAHKKSDEIINNYLTWLKPKISPKLHDLLIKINEKGSIYYDSLNKVIKEINTTKAEEKNLTPLQAKDFQQLQLPRIELEEIKEKFSCPFKVSIENDQIRVDLNINNEKLYIKGKDPFVIAYSIMRQLGKNKDKLSSLNQLLLGAELGRVNTELVNNISFPSFISPSKEKGQKEIKLEPVIDLKIDNRYYYKVNTRNQKISVMCLAFDACEKVFELLAETAPTLIKRIDKEDRFESYEMDILHRLDIGTQIGRAAVATKLGYSFIQDFDVIFSINKEHFPLCLAEGDSFLDVHKSVLRKIYTEGLTEDHGDKWKGLARSASVLSIFRDTSIALKVIPKIYDQGEQKAEKARANYKKQLLRLDHDGSYSYGERTRAYFGFDQLTKTIELLKKNPDQATIIQRFDPVKDMSFEINKENGQIKYTHDPCLTHDIFFIQNGKLNSFHIARAHNTVNAYPENIFGLYDAYTKTVAESLGLPTGDLFMLSNRANILLLTEEQKTKKILGEPSRPNEKTDKETGPYQLGKNIKLPTDKKGVAYINFQAQKEVEKPNDKILDKLENYQGQNILKKAIDYLKNKGVMHNNPILSEFYPGQDEAQGDKLVFFQANVLGGKVNGTAVFANHSLAKLTKDQKLINYLLTQYSTNLNYPLGEALIFYVNFTK